MQKQQGEFGVVARTKGGPEVLQWTELETAAPAAGEVRLAQKAIGLNFIDVYYRQGAYPWTGDILIPGGEAAGIVEAVGSGTPFEVGDRVAYTMPTGAYRTHRVVAADRLVKLPEGVSFEDAACDVVYDSVGHDTWRGSLKCLRPRGTFVCFGQSSGPITDFKFADLAAGSLFATRPGLWEHI